jgi:dTDP-4-amino-4,6-dideoxygalactose transaminase
MHIPFVNLKAQYESIKTAIDDAIGSVINNFCFSRGAEVFEFEQQFAAKINARHCIAVGNGTDALYLSLKALEIGQDDEVLTPAWSWISSAETITQCGAKPVFVDVDPKYYTIDIARVEQKITEKTRAIIAVHLYGHAAPVVALKSICKRHNLFLIEDCAQSHLTKEDDNYVGTFGDLSAFSFYPTKNLGAYGDAGCVFTNDAVMEERVRRLANHGALQKEDHLIEGMNSRMDTLQAAILSAKLPYLEQWTEKRRAHADHYTNRLRNIDQVHTPVQRASCHHSFHIYAIRAQRRDELQSFLQANGIQTLIHYRKALVNVPAYAHLKQDPDDFPVAISLEKEILSLPIYPELSYEAVDYICDKIAGFYEMRP